MGNWQPLSASFRPPYSRWPFFDTQHELVVVNAELAGLNTLALNMQPSPEPSFNDEVTL